MLLFYPLRQCQDLFVGVSIRFAISSSSTRCSRHALSSEADKPIVQDSQDIEQRLQPLRQRIYNLVYRNLGNRDDAEDVTQETFIRAWSHSERFDASRSFEAWVIRIALNLCIDTVRRRRRQRTASLDAAP